MTVKIWVDDVRPAPEGYMWADSTNTAIGIIKICIDSNIDIDLIDLDYDAGEYAYDGGDYIKILDWLERIGQSFPIRIYSMNPVGVENMRRIIEKNGCVEII